MPKTFRITALVVSGVALAIPAHATSFGAFAAEAGTSAAITWGAAAVGYTVFTQSESTGGD